MYISTPTQTPVERFEWAFASLDWLPLGPVSASVTYKLRGELVVAHDTECPNRNHVSLVNFRLNISTIFSMSLSMFPVLFVTFEPIVIFLILLSDQWTVTILTESFCFICVLACGWVHIQRYFWIKYDLGQKYYYAPPTPRPGFELMNSRLWQYSSCHWDACSNHLAISDFVWRILGSLVISWVVTESHVCYQLGDAG